MQSKSAPKRKGEIMVVRDWTVSALIIVAKEMGLINKSEECLCCFINEQRNCIHAKKEIDEKFSPDEKDALFTFDALQKILKKINV